MRIGRVNNSVNQTEQTNLPPSLPPSHTHTHVLTWDWPKVRLFLDLAWNGKLSQQLKSVILCPPGLLPVPNR